MVNMSFVFMIVTGSFSIIFNPPIILKILNYFILSASLLVQFENLVGQTVFIRSMDLIDNGEKLSITTHKGKTKVLLTKNLKKAINDNRVYNSKNLNHEFFLIFTSSENKIVYHIPRMGLFTNENFLDELLDGKAIK